MIPATVDIEFVNLGIQISDLNNTVAVFGVELAWYGIIMGIAMLCGIGIAAWDAHRQGQKIELYVDFAIYGIIFAIIGARAYYVLFSWNYFSKNPSEILNISGGGMAIYGGIIASVATLFVFAKIKKQSPWRMLDTAVLGLVLGQAIGRWGNFMNCEAFGGYTEGLFAMRLNRSLVFDSSVTAELAAHSVLVDGVEYIQVHPTFLYESLWNIGLLIVLLVFRKHKKFDGEVFWWYLAGYGIGRAWIEGLRTDQLILGNTGIPVSQALSVFLAASAALVVIRRRKKLLGQK